jgi:uncharacterized RDD family membrane protein YckC
MTADPGMIADPLAGMPPLANRFRRLVARVIDFLIVSIPVYGLWAIGAHGWGTYGYFSGRAYLESVVYELVYFAYQVFMLTHFSRSVGKMVMGIRVAMLADGAMPSLGAAARREGTYSLPLLLSCVGLIFWYVNVLWCLWDRPFHQCLHDKAGRTVVVTEHPAPATAATPKAF